MLLKLVRGAKIRQWRCADPLWCFWSWAARGLSLDLSSFYEQVVGD